MIFGTYYLESIYGPVLLKRKEKTEPKCDDIIEMGKNIESSKVRMTTKCGNG